MTTLIVRRESAWADHFRSYSVQVNGEIRQLKRNSQVAVDVPDGQNVEVSVAIDWTRAAKWSGNPSGDSGEIRLLVEHDDIVGGIFGGNYLKIGPERTAPPRAL